MGMNHGRGFYEHLLVSKIVVVDAHSY